MLRSPCEQKLLAVPPTEANRVGGGGGGGGGGKGVLLAGHYVDPQVRQVKSHTERIHFTRLVDPRCDE